ncbi:GNAT family N-acetyltransferase [Micromonospora sagamiensis]|uniref:N-acetylglutamate synthase-like GNAT family acetyltransferase n=1 Tax=Micromonospora sagamiensis TaxID=47875 RepID=A0A562WAB5_9ACTN|nr:GNAT family N-acetyltransferase [Micromonospora sagamiensis]TWJ26907.1 N-acetylglutamate synthase-like GNAT family acetyltransferase [Micromonospora sagamiensis]BCL14204.1 phosphinothricin acetyltransferase [Micromonospora sagamiensis]
MAEPPPVRHLIRTARPDDAAGVVALRAVVHPYLVRGVESTRQMITAPPPGEDWAAFVAEVDATVVGWVSAYRYLRSSTPTSGEVAMLHVHPGHRGRGVGNALLDRALGHLAPLGLARVRTWVTTGSLPFAEKRGFVPSRKARYAALDLRGTPPVPPLPTGTRLLALTELAPRRLYEAYVAASADEPDDLPSDALGYEQWRFEVWDNVGLDPRASSVLEVDGKLAAFSLVKRDGDRMWSDMTATVPAYRGRGLARLAKLAALHRARATGVRHAYTSNDEANAPMLAINARLGYQPVATLWSCLRDLAAEG